MFTPVRRWYPARAEPEESLLHCLSTCLVSRPLRLGAEPLLQLPPAGRVVLETALGQTLHLDEAREIHVPGAEWGTRSPLVSVWCLLARSTAEDAVDRHFARYQY